MRLTRWADLGVVAMELVMTSGDSVIGWTVVQIKELAILWKSTSLLHWKEQIHILCKQSHIGPDC